MTRALLTGFEPFGTDAVNPSGLAVRRVAARWRGPGELITAVLPVTFADAPAALRSLLEEHQPDLVIATGLAGDRSAVTPERVAVNLVDARIPDNADRRPIDEPVLRGGPAAYFSTLPVKAIARDIRTAGIPAELSHSAGSFVCNQVFYAAMAATAATPEVRAGFVHVPWSSEHAPGGAPSLPLDAIVMAIEIALLTSIRSTHHARIAGGTIS
ncbi:pyroglutamyl-peptidase I [Microbacterium pygmaeum]|uniref:Pyrrolidone-carboxylate peptidase n=1 Tax=Microbacterium pygmaeum TaxID=370764 RepID=A0A1G8C630_9MICO|nr:pyroglutamyl-peptidase I [Microbacterium pygmaeum]SDH40852.1 pyroglutamyl-peptidase [Microbacterium pygmaeum]